MVFTIESKKYSVMEEEFDKAAKIIKNAILADRQIIIRHHNDCDGISAGISLEYSCKKLMGNALIKPHFNLFRFSCRAPYYDFPDFVKDFNTIKRFRSKKLTRPLLIILDNGSTEEDFFALKSMSDVGVEVIVVDHHIPQIIGENKSKNCNFLSAHINPHLFGFGSELSAGMLSFELSNKLYKLDNYILPAIAGLDDKVQGSELNQYVEKSNKSQVELLKIASALDFLVYNSKFDLESSVFEELFHNVDLVNTINSQIESLTEAKLKTINKAINVEDLGGINFISIDISNYSERFSYPRTGKITELIMDTFENAFVCSILETSITIRQSKAFIPISDLILRLQKELPLANIKGGGHAVAGTISFIKAYQGKVIEQIKVTLKK